MPARHCSSWADLQPELLGVVLRRLRYLADRVRLGAVCRSWRRGARLEPVPPPWPWLALLDGTFVSVPDGEVHRAPAAAAAVPLGDDNARCHGSVGSWLFLERTVPTSCGGERSTMSLVNLFSGDAVRLPDADALWRHEPVGDDSDTERRRPVVYKPPVPLRPSSSVDAGVLSPDSLFAVLITDDHFESVISVCNSSAAAAFRVPGRERIHDVALHGGKLYALSPFKLFVLEVDSSCRAGEPKIPAMECIDDDLGNPGLLYKTIAGEMYTCAYWSYHVESRGKLLRVMRLVGHLSDLPWYDHIDQSHTFSFEVFEADLTTTPSRVQWRRVYSLGGQALFVGPSSKSLPASECGAQPDCIYFVCDYVWGHHWRDPLRDRGVFNMRDGTITPLLPGITVTRPKDNDDYDDDEFYPARLRPGWFFPLLKLCNAPARGGGKARTGSASHVNSWMVTDFSVLDICTTISADYSMVTNFSLVNGKF